MRHRRPLSTSEIRARRRNARLSRGPRTKEGRRRSRLNFRCPEIPAAAYPLLESLHETPEGYTRTWRDLLSIFWFLGPQIEPYINILAWDLWLKERYARRSAPLHTLQVIEARIEEWLGHAVNACGRIHRKDRAQLQREIGSNGDLGMRELRLAIEARLPGYRRLASEGKLPAISPSEAAFYEFERTLGEIEASFSRLRAAGEGVL